ncbi:hypothetical protein [Streptococcus pneumoniae]|nr:hypothetical protein [Streptococcus pneumoniae]
MVPLKSENGYRTYS